jgi:heavy metal sensor kinase
MKLSIRSKLTLGYIGTVAALLAVFVGADVVRLRGSLLSHADEGLPVESLLQTWRHELWEHGLLMIILIVLTSVVGYVFIRRVLRPVRRIVETARSITAEDLSRRVDDLGDRDEIGRLARTINEMIARLESSFRQVQRFSGDASHELNTPLAVMKGELEVALRKERTGEEYREVLNRLLDEVNRLSGIVDDLLFLSRVDAKSVERSTRAVLLHKTVLEAFEESSRLANGRDVAVRLERIDEIEVRGDASLFKRMVANLLDNAIKYSSREGGVSLSLTSRGDAATLIIEDNGTGIEDKDIPRIFNRFYRADLSRSKRTGGVGLGLSIVREIADLYDLDVRVQSEKEKGTRVTVAWKPAV